MLVTGLDLDVSLNTEVLGCCLQHEAEVLSLDLWFGLVFCLELSKFQGRGLVKTSVF